MRIIINKAQNWPVLMRQKWRTEDEVETTPFREMIKLAPGVLIYMVAVVTASTA